MNYFEWADEYYTTADEVQKKINGYQKGLKTGSVKNRYLINEKIKNLKSRHEELIHTANELREKAVRIQDKETKQRQMAEETKISIARFLQEQTNDT